MDVKIVCFLAFLSIKDVASFTTKANTVTVTGAPWQVLPLVPSPLNLLSFSNKKTANGAEHNNSLDALLKTSPTISEGVILKVRLDTGENIIIGDLDLPVRFNFATSLNNCKITVDHKSWRPYLYLTS